MPIAPSRRDTPDTRRLLALLGEAQAVAERVYAARGRVDTSVLIRPGESAGYDLAETISVIARRVRREVNGSGTGPEPQRGVGLLVSLVGPLTAPSPAFGPSPAPFPTQRARGSLVTEKASAQRRGLFGTRLGAQE